MTPAWVPRATFILSLAALAISGYLTVAHYSSPDILACAEGGLVNCAQVTTSAQSTFVGIPVAVLGLGWSIAMVALCSTPAWRSSSAAVHAGRIALSVLGIGFVLWLVYAELYIVRAICLWCTAMHVVVFAAFAVIVSVGMPERHHASTPT